jgi:hypothetical protein
VNEEEERASSADAHLSVIKHRVGHVEHRKRVAVIGELVRRGGRW